MSYKQFISIISLNDKSDSYREKVLTSIVKHLPKDDDVYN